MLRGLNWISGGAGIFVFLILLNYVFSGEIGFFQAGLGRSHGREALLIVVGLGCVVWGLFLTLIPGLPNWVAEMAGGYERDGFYSTKWSPPLPPKITRALPVSGRSIDYGERMVANLRPATVLLDLAAFDERFSGNERLVHEHYGDHTGSNPSIEELAVLERAKAATREKYLGDPNFVRAAKRLSRAGVSCEFGGQGDMCGEFSVLRIVGSVASLPLLEAMAADDARISDATERAAAAERFRIFIKRNYSPAWEKNRTIYPDVGGSPYVDSAHWPSST